MCQVCDCGGVKYVTVEVSQVAHNQVTMGSTILKEEADVVSDLVVRQYLQMATQ